MFTAELLQKQPTQFGIRPVVGIVEFFGAEEATSEQATRIEGLKDPYAYRWVHSPACLEETDLATFAREIATSLSCRVTCGSVRDYDWETSKIGV